MSHILKENEGKAPWFRAVFTLRTSLSSILSRANDCGHVWSDLRLNVGDLGAASNSDRSCSLLTFLLMMAMTKNTCPIFFYRYAVPVGCTDQFVKFLRSQKLHVVMYSTFLMLCITSFMVF